VGVLNIHKENGEKVSKGCREEGSNFRAKELKKIQAGGLGGGLRAAKKKKGL